MAESSTITREGAIAALERENRELRAYLKAFCAATVDPEDQGQDVGRHEANPFIEYEFALVDEGVRPDRTITGGQVRRAMELVGFDKLKIQPADKTISEELTEARDLRLAIKDLSASVPVPTPGTEERDFWLEAARQHGFEETSEEQLPYLALPAYCAVEEALLELMAAAREQGRKDVLDALATGGAR